MQMQTLRRSLSTIRPFSHLVKSKSAPRDAGPDENVDDDEKKAGPTDENDDDDLDAGADENSDKRKNKPNEDNDDEDSDEEDEKDDEAVKKARAAGHARALKAVARRARRAERLRGAAIFQSAHASGRIELAANLAFNSTMSVRDAIATLATSGEMIGDFAATPGQRLMQAALHLADKMPGQRTPAPPQFAAERARIHKLGFAEARIRAHGGKYMKEGLSLLRAAAALPPPPRRF